MPKEQQYEIHVLAHKTFNVVAESPDKARDIARKLAYGSDLNTFEVGATEHTGVTLGPPKNEDGEYICGRPVKCHTYNGKTYRQCQNRVNKMYDTCHLHDKNK